MNRQKVVIGVDIGTTSTKTVVFNMDGKVVAKHEIGYPIIYPQPAWAEQDPNIILNAVIDTLRKASNEVNARSGQIIAVGFSSAMHSLIAIDQEGRPMTNSIIWADNRSVPQTFALNNRLEGNDIYKRTGTPIHPMSPLPKLLWMKGNDPETYAKTLKFISIKEYIIYHFFQEYLIDYSIASATGLFNINTLKWDMDVLELLSIRADQLSSPVPTTYRLQGLIQDIALRTGLARDTPFIIGASDGVLANLGVGAINAGEVAVTIGTSGAIRSVTNKPKTDDRGRTFCYNLTKDHWVIGGPTNNGGVALRWVHDQFAQKEIELARNLRTDSYQTLIDLAATVPAGAEGLLFLPYLSGERAPHWNPKARGMFFGMNINHKREHFFRAVLEGIIFSVHDVGVILEELSGTTKDVRASGGFAKSHVWRQILSDVMGHEVLVPESHEASALGAAFLALLSLNEVNELSDIKEWLHIKEKHIPNFENHKRYTKMFSIYRRLYNNLTEEFDAITEIQNEATK